MNDKEEYNEYLNKALHHLEFASDKFSSYTINSNYGIVFINLATDEPDPERKLGYLMQAKSLYEKVVEECPHVLDGWLKLINTYVAIIEVLKPDNNEHPVIQKAHDLIENWDKVDSEPEYVVVANFLKELLS